MKELLKNQIQKEENCKMSLKKYLLESENFRCIHLFDTNELSMRDECMLSYLIELADYKNCDYRQMEITAKYIQIRKPNWKDRDIKESLKSLCELGYINLEGTHGRGNCYTLNIDFIKEKLLESNTAVEESEKQTLKNYESELKVDSINKPFYYLEQQEMELLASIDYVSNTIQKDEYGFFKCNPDFLQFYFKPCLTENEIVNSVKELTMLGYLEHEYIGTDLYIMVTDKTHEEMYMYTVDCIKEEK